MGVFVILFCQKVGLGGGIQFWRAVLVDNLATTPRHKAYTTAGLGALGIGYNYAVSSKVSVGANYSVFLIALAVATGPTVDVNYHFGSTSGRGWVAGVDFGRGQFGFDDNSSTNIALISGDFVF